MVVIAEYIAIGQNLVEVGSCCVDTCLCTSTTERLSVTDSWRVIECFAVIRKIITVICRKLEILQEWDFYIWTWSQVIIHAFTDVLSHVGYHILISCSRAFGCTVCFTVSGIIHGTSVFIIFHVTFCVIGMNREDRSPGACHSERIRSSSGIFLYTVLSSFGIPYIGTYFQPRLQLGVNIGASCKTFIRRT